MQLLVILLVAIVLGRDGLDSAGDAFADARWVPWTAAWIPALTLVVVQDLVVRWCMRRLPTEKGPRAVTSADRLLRRAPWVALATLGIAVFFFGWAAEVERCLGGSILLDEMLAIAPVLLVLVAGWWSWYPVERHLRDAALIRRLDLGLVIVPLPPRGTYVLQQLRIHVLLLLVPILLAIGLGEAVMMVTTRAVPERAAWIDGAVSLGCVALIFLLAPAIVRLVLDVRPLPAGEIRTDMERVCRAHRVRVSNILLWRTGGTMINAAVVGLAPFLRYVLLSDALLDCMTRDQLRAVMAHEIGHVRRRHMVWLGMALIAGMVGAAFVLELGVWFTVATPVHDGARAVPAWAETVSVTGAAIVALLAFGFASRRFERQADAFAVAHLSRGPDDDAPAEAGSEVITASAVAAMCDALETVAQLNNVDPERRSWRHGSIRWRQRALGRLINCPLSRLPIDREVRVINVLSAAIVLLLAAVAAWETIQG